MTQPTIIALSTPPGRSAISVIRMSGPGVAACFKAFGVDIPRPRRATLATLRDGDDPIDQALVLRFAAPASFTGEDMAEFHLHGSPAVVARVLAMAQELPGTRLAGPGEFTRRALQMGKIDLIGAEALGDLIDSDTERQRRQAIKALGGGLRVRVDALRERLIECAASLAAAIDFSDEDDVPASVLEPLRRMLSDIGAGIDTLLRAASSSEIVRNGMRVAILGAPNAGKSSLLNALAGRDIAIVTAVPGTTRDRIEARLSLEGYAFTLIDTAGLRETDDEVEAIGVHRSREAALEADLVIWLAPVDQALLAIPGEIRAKSLIVRSKSDLGVALRPGSLENEQSIAVSVLSPNGLDALRAELLKRVEVLAAMPEEAIVVTRSRQKRLIEEAGSAVERAMGLGCHHPELIAEEIRCASNALGALTGAIGVDDVLDAVFSRYCIGK